jgi:hypothetical protein
LIEAAQALLPLAYSVGSEADPAIIALMLTVAAHIPASIFPQSHARRATPRDAWPRGTEMMSS